MKKYILLIGLLVLSNSFRDQSFADGSIQILSHPEKATKYDADGSIQVLSHPEKPTKYDAEKYNRIGMWEFGKTLHRYGYISMFGSAPNSLREFKVNFSLAFILFKEAAFKYGYFKGNSQIAYMYEVGYGFDQSYEKAFKWYEIAAHQGDDMAQYRLALLYSDGVQYYPIVENLVEAYKWASFSAKQNYYFAEQFLSTLKEKMTEQQITEAEKLIKEFSPKAIKLEEKDYPTFPRDKGIEFLKI